MGVICIFAALATSQHDDVFDAITTVMSALGLIAIFHIAQFVWFYWQWGDAFTWTLPGSSALVAAMVALTQIAALTVQVTPALPELPFPLLAALCAVLIYAVVRQRRL
jgi:hypothetical protein